MNFIAENIVSSVRKLGTVSVFSNNFIFVIILSIVKDGILIRGFFTNFFIFRGKKIKKKSKTFPHFQFAQCLKTSPCSKSFDC